MAINHETEQNRNIIKYAKFTVLPSYTNYDQESKTKNNNT